MTLNRRQMLFTTGAALLGAPSMSRALAADKGNPKRILPYTGMPVNIQHDKPVSQSLYSGTSMDQLNAVVDLLLNYDRFTDRKTLITPLTKPPKPAASTTEPAAASSQASAR